VYSGIENNLKERGIECNEELEPENVANGRLFVNPLHLLLEDAGPSQTSISTTVNVIACFFAA
jgi:hypothetical protein